MNNEESAWSRPLTVVILLDIDGDKWIDDVEFYDEVINDIETAEGYGISILDKISKHYGYKRELNETK